MATIKEQLIALGMDEKKDFDRHESDLYVRVTPISKKWLETYEFKSNVNSFLDQIEKVFWFEIPFAAMEEKIAAEKADAERLAARCRERMAAAKA